MHCLHRPRDQRADAPWARFATVIDPADCAVRMSSTTLTEADARLLQQRYGERLRLDRTCDARRT